MRLHHTKLGLFPIFLVLYEMGTYLSNDMYLPALPQMMKDLHLNTQQAQLTLTTWFIGAAFMPLFMGAIADRFGRRPVLLGGGLIYVMSTIACALAMQLHFLLVARFIQGSMLASMSVAGYACIHESYEKLDAIKILAIMGSITILAPALGPLLGGFVLLIGDWRVIFALIAVWAIIPLAFLYQKMPETLPPEKRTKLHLIQLFRDYKQVLSNKYFVLLAVIMGSIFGGFIMWIAAGPLLLIETFHFDPVQFGGIQAIVFVAYMGANYFAKRKIESVGIKRMVWTGLLISLGGGLVMFLTGIYTDAIWLFIIAMSIYSFGSGLCFAPISRSIIEVSEGPMGMRIALSNVLMTGFGVIGTVIVSVFFNGTIASLAYPVGAAGILGVFLALFTLKLDL